MKKRLFLKFFILFSFVLIVIFAFYVWYSPYLFLRSFQKAILKGDIVRIEQMVDFFKIQKELKAKFWSEWLEIAGKEAQQDPLVFGLASLFISGMMEHLVDTIISPEKLIALGNLEEIENWRLQYVSFRTAYIYNPKNPNVRFYLERQGLFNWKIVHIYFK